MARREDSQNFRSSAVFVLSRVGGMSVTAEAIRKIVRLSDISPR